MENHDVNSLYFSLKCFSCTDQRGMNFVVYIYYQISNLIQKYICQVITAYNPLASLYRKIQSSRNISTAQVRFSKGFVFFYTTTLKGCMWFITWLLYYIIFLYFYYIILYFYFIFLCHITDNQLTSYKEDIV